jgi:hypothetical protein
MLALLANSIPVAGLLLACLFFIGDLFDQNFYYL